MAKYAPLPGSTLMIAIFGFFISTVYIMKRWPSFGFAFTMVFVIMFIASMISMTYADTDELIKLDEWERSGKGNIKLENTELSAKIEKFLGLMKKGKKKK